MPPAAGNRMFPSYKLMLDRSNEFLLAARKRKHQKKGSNYLISIDESDLHKASGNYFGKCKANFLGTQFVLYDKGTKPAELGGGTSVLNPRKELAGILYDYNVLGTKGPRKMHVIVPGCNADGSIAAEEQEGVLGRWNKGSGSLPPGGSYMSNKEPKWNEELGAYCLNFSGRVTRPSVKNFQLGIVGNPDEDQVSLQFGKTGEHTFTMDFAHPLTPLQAFGIVLSSFDNKFACE